VTEPTQRIELVTPATIAEEMVSAAVDPKVLWCSLATAYDRTVAGNYVGTDTAGDRIHPNDASHAAAYSMISAFLAANNVTL
jgi:hypothetical protein